MDNQAKLPHHQSSDVSDHENRYKALLDTIDVGVAVYGVEDGGQRFVFQEFNRAAEEMDGLERDQVIGQEVRDVFLGAEKMGIVEVFRKVNETGEEEYFPKAQYPLEDGSSVWRENKVYKLQSGEIVALYRDITSRIEAEARLSSAEAKFRNAFDNAAIGIALVSPEGRWLDVNVSLCKMIGYSKEELLKLTFQDITHPDDLESDMVLVQEMLDKKRDNYQMNKRYYHKNGDIVSVLLNVSLVRGSDGLPQFFISQIQDVTEKERIKQKLEKNQERLRYAMEGTSDGLWDWDIQTNQVYYSPRWKSMLGYDEAEIKNDFSEWELRLHPDDKQQVVKYVQDFVKGIRDKFDTQFQMKHKKGHWVHIRARAQLIVDEQGNPIRVVGTHSDVSKQEKNSKELEERIKHQEKLNRLMVGRELKMVELKKRIKELERK